MLKHYGPHGNPSGGLNLASVDCGLYDLHAVYLKPFEMVLRHLPVYAVMSTYNSWNRIPNSASRYLLTDILRDRWGFKGYVYSDWGAIEMLETFHHTAANKAEAATQALTAGLDVEASSECYPELFRLVKEGKLDESYIDTAVRRVLTAKFECGLFENPYGNRYTASGEMHSLRSVELSRQIAEESIVLLKNENNALPISKKDKVSVFGRNSTDFVVGLSSGGGKISGDDDLKTVFDSVGLSINETLWNYYANSEEPKRRSSEEIRVGEIDPASYPADVTSSYAKYSDAAFVVISRNFGEGHDAPIDPAAILDGDGTHYALQLQDKERAVIEEAKKCSDKVIVIINSDNAMEIGELKDDPDVDAILQVGGTGVYGLYGVANVITGEVSPSGHLVDTYAYSNFSSPASQNYGDFSFSNYDHTYVIYQEGIYVGYKYYETRYEDMVMGQGNADSTAGAVNSTGNWNYDEEIVYPFGYGLSYSDFTQEITDITWDTQNRTVTVTVDVKNVGAYDGKSVVELYAQTPYTDYDKANQVEKSSVQLVGYGKTQTLEAGTGEESVTITVNMDHLASYDYTNAKTYILDYGTYYFSVGNGAHEALNNILSAKGYSQENGMDADGNTAMVVSYDYTGSGNVDQQTCSSSAYTGEAITNQLESVDLNYYGEDMVTYLSRNDWSGTWSGALDLTATEQMQQLLSDGSSYSVDSANNDLSGVQEGDNYASTATSVNFYELYGKEYDDPIWEDALNQLTLDLSLIHI